MRKKLLSIILAAFLVISFVGCDEFSSMINKVQTGASFYQEYTKYSGIFEEATELIVDAETSITVGETSLPVAPVDVLSNLYIMSDVENQLIYADVLIDGVAQKAVHDQASDIVYLIDETIVTPTIPAVGEEVFDANMDASNILKEDFNAENITNENLSEDGVYSFDINLNDAVNLEELSEFLTQITPDGFDTPTLADAVAHIEIKFMEEVIGEETKYDIDVRVSLTDYRIEFDEETYIVISVVNHSIITVPVEFNFPQIFTDAYEFVAPVNHNLATRVYNADEVINYPVTAMQDGYAQLSLIAGDYEVITLQPDNFTYQIFDLEMNEIIVTDGVFTIEADGNYYILIKPTVSFQCDVYVTPVVATE